MAEPVSWLTLESYREEVLKITPANGYLTAIGDGQIILDRAKLTLSDVPVTLITAGDIVPKEGAQGRGVMSSDMDISFEVAVPFDTENAELVAHRARADLIRMLLSAANRFVAGRGSIVITGSAIDSDANAAGISFTLAQVTARAGLTETYSLAE